MLFRKKKSAFFPPLELKQPYIGSVYMVLREATAKVLLKYIITDIYLYQLTGAPTPLKVLKKHKI